MWMGKVGSSVLFRDHWREMSEPGVGGVVLDGREDGSISKACEGVRRENAIARSERGSGCRILQGGDETAQSKGSRGRTEESRY
jgi:hypothetical protein